MRRLISDTTVACMDPDPDASMDSVDSLADCAFKKALASGLLYLKHDYFIEDYNILLVQTKEVRRRKEQQ